VILGRQLVAQGFDFVLVDGAQAPLYWSTDAEREGGVWAYGGWGRTMDLFDFSGAPFAGATVFQTVSRFKLQAGWTVRQTSFSDHTIFGSAFRSFDELPLKPSVLVKAEIGTPTFGLSQTWNELSISPVDDWVISAAYSLRNPRRIAVIASDFIYSTLAAGAVESGQVTSRLQVSQPLRIDLMGRLMKFNSGTQIDYGYQAELSAVWDIGAGHHFQPLAAYLRGYGGWMADFGAAHIWDISDRTQLRTEIAAAYMNKVNNITTWVYQWREGLRHFLAPRWSLGLWGELERSHRYEFDTRMIASVTHYH
jgi:hypothetical protein